jgi:hypothetical protein
LSGTDVFSTGCARRARAASAPLRTLAFGKPVVAVGSK